MAKVLVVDDEPNIRLLLETVLQSEGLQVITASDGQEGLQRFHTENPDALVLDLKMPGMTGADLLARLKGDGMAKVPVIVVSGSQEVTPLPDGIQVAGVWTKPFDIFAFASAVRTVCREAV